MLKVLIKKQISEIFRSYFYDAKKNTARSKAATVGMTLLFILLMVGILGGMFTGFSLMLCPSLAQANMSWLYFAIMGLLSILMGTFGSVFTTYSTLYLPKDNDLLLSMPIPVGTLMTSRLVSVYLMGVMYSGVIIVPATVVYWITAELSVKSVLGGILFPLLLSVFVMTLSCGLGWVVAKISVKLKHKSFITVIVSLVFFAAYYFFYFKAQTVISDIVSNAATYGEKLRTSAYPVYVFGNAGTGDALSLAILAAVIVALFVLAWALISHSFLKIATATGSSAGKKYREKTAKQKGVASALLTREFSRFTSSPNYMLNCGLGVLFMLIAGVFLIIKGQGLFSVINGVFGSRPGSLLAIMCAGLCAMASMNDTTAPSVSLEGKSLWIAQSLPVKPWQVLQAKLKVQLFLTVPAVLFCIVCLAFTFPMTVWEVVFAALMSVSFTLLFALFGLFVGVKKAVLTWTSEITPIKQSAAVVLSLLGGMAYSVVYGLVFMATDAGKLGFVPYTAIWVGVTAVLCAVLYAWLKNNGSRTFANL